MAVDSLTTESQAELNTLSVSQETTKPNKEVTINTEATTDSEKSEDKCTTDFDKKKKLDRKATELLLHLYSTQETTDRKCLLYSKRDDSGSENELFDDDIDWECEPLKIFSHKRTNNYCRAKRERVSFKEQKFREFCRKHETPDDIVLEKGTRKSVRVKFDRTDKQISKNSNRKDHNERRKANIEKKLKKWGIKRRGIIPGVGNTGDENPGMPEKFQIHKDNAPGEMQDMLAFLMSLQDRDVSPEDYELLLKLDDLVPKKTVSDECLHRLHEEDVDNSHAHEICGICMEDYKIGETRKILPCKHVFHSNCIEQWLSQSSTKCPLDGLVLRI